MLEPGPLKVMLGTSSTYISFERELMITGDTVEIADSKVFFSDVSVLAN